MSYEEIHLAMVNAIEGNDYSTLDEYHKALYDKNDLASIWINGKVVVMGYQQAHHHSPERFPRGAT